MRTLAALVFIAGVAATAIAVARMPTVADGRVMEAALLPAIRDQGVVGVACDREIPIGRDGALFACTATLSGGTPHELACTLERSGRFTCQPAGAAPSGIATSGDPWGN